MSYFDRHVETLPRTGLLRMQFGRLRSLLSEIQGKNKFYTDKFAGSVPKRDGLAGWEQFRQVPFTTKQELVEDQFKHGPFGRNLTYPEADYTRFHQTSGTTGRPLKILDTPASWDWWGKCWGYVLAGAGVTSQDRLFVAFGFGPFIGFWASVEGARHVRALMIPGGARDSLQRLHLLLESGSTALCCTPTYALRLAEVARENGIDLPSSAITRTIHAGEPGANLPAIKAKIESAWGAKCYDHAGASEVGAYAFECGAQPGGMHFNEAEFIIEVLDPATDQAVAEGEGELVVTSLGRSAFPVIRYRTGDIVNLQQESCACGRTFVRCRGGIIGRRDDMVTVRGVNIYPGALENLIRSVPEVVEFRVTVEKDAGLAILRVEIECHPAVENSAVEEKVARTLSNALGMRPQVKSVAPDVLPRFELKAKRFHIIK